MKQLVLACLLLFVSAFAVGDALRFGDFARASDWPDRYSWMQTSHPAKGFQHELEKMPLRELSIDDTSRRGPKETAYTWRVMADMTMELDVAWGLEHAAWIKNPSAGTLYGTCDSELYIRMCQFVESSGFRLAESGNFHAGGTFPPVGLAIEWKDGHKQRMEFARVNAPIELWTLKALVDRIVKSTEWVATKNEDR